MTLIEIARLGKFIRELTGQNDGAWVVSFVNLDAGTSTTAWAEVALLVIYIAAFLVRETRRWRWELR